MSLPTRPTLIDTQAGLERFCAEAQSARLIALDTEFENQKTYWPELAVIQVATPTQLALIDAVAGLDLRPFLDLIADPDKILIVYSGEADIELLHHAGAPAWGPVFDVQIAARFLGLGFSGGLGRLVEILLGVEMQKSESTRRSDWCERPLTPKQIRYAADDVRYLIPVYERLLEILRECRRAAWAWEEMGALEDPARYTRTPQTRFRVRGAQRAGPRLKALVHAVCAWRDGLARAENRPARYILDDKDVMRLARAAESRHREPIVTGFGAQADEDLRRSLKASQASPRKSGPRRDSRAPLVPLEVLKEALRHKAELLGVDATLLATTDQLKSFSKHPYESPFHGWRAVVFADWHARWG